MLRPIYFALPTLILAVFASPQAAKAWTEEPIHVTPDNSNKFTDPDEKIESMAEGSNDHHRGLSYNFGEGSSGSSVTFSMTPQPSSNQSPFSPMSNSMWPNQRR